MLGAEGANLPDNLSGKRTAWGRHLWKVGLGPTDGETDALHRETLRSRLSRETEGEMTHVCLRP